MTETDKWIRAFEVLGNWELRYQYLIDLGEKLPRLPAEEKTEATRVDGCASEVWVKAVFEAGDPPVMTFEADSDALAVRGMLEMLRSLYAGRTAEQVLALDVYGLFQHTGLMEHLSPSRQQGLRSLVERLRGLAGLQLSASKAGLGK
jgi:cysteine desulfuration protein SufE